MPPRLPPSQPLRTKDEEASPKDSRWSRIKLAFSRFFLRRIGFAHDATDMLRSAMKLGNPTKAQWPSETIPMNARIFASGFWNYSFFQFNRKFLPPFWAEEQYNPESKSFLPRSHNVLSLNQTQRNWVAIGFPGRSLEASLDMAGSLMVYPGSYTVEFATIENERIVRPQNDVQYVHLELKSSYELHIAWRDIRIIYTATAYGIHFKATGDSPLLLSIRPFNFEGPALLYKLHYNERKLQLTGDAEFSFDAPPTRVLLSNRRKGDALRRIAAQMRSPQEGDTEIFDVKDTIGLATGAFYFARASLASGKIFDRQDDALPASITQKSAEGITSHFFSNTLTAQLPKDYGVWLEHAKHHLVALWDFDSIKPGSYTYHHFWIRDAVIMMYALLLVGAKHAVKPILERFTGLVKRSGLFRSQSGEWDANGQALWILAQYARLTQDTSVIDSMKKHITRMLSWYEKTLAHHGGVLPPGFSAEHLGPADWYLWDNFWALGGLKEIAPYLNDAAMVQRATTIYKTLSMRLGEYLNSYPYLPAALGRSKDAGMIGSIIVGYPLQVTDFLDARYLDSLDIIHKNYFFQGCFFQENIHSGLNPYLTLQMAESYLFVGKTGAARKILRNIKRRAQKAYSYPEAIHVRTGGGCMGDGFHGWASAEAVIMIRNLVVREVTLKTKTSALVWLAGYREKWLYEKSYVENIYTQHSHATLTLSDCHLTLENISMKETHILSLPQGFVPVDTTTNKALPYFAHENFIPVADTERNYFLLDKDDGKKTTLHLAKP